jgi:hypothetical protein
MPFGVGRALMPSGVRARRSVACGGADSFGRPAAAPAVGGFNAAPDLGRMTCRVKLSRGERCAAAKLDQHVGVVDHGDTGTSAVVPQLSRRHTNSVREHLRRHETSSSARGKVCTARYWCAGQAARRHRQPRRLGQGCGRSGRDSKAPTASPAVDVRPLWTGCPTSSHDAAHGYVDAERALLAYELDRRPVV